MSLTYSPGRAVDARLVGLLFLFTFVLAMKLGGIPTGAPFIFDVDEPDFIKRAVRIAATGDLNPHWFGHPGTTTIYLLSAIFSLEARMLGEEASTLLQSYAYDPEPFHRLGKYVNALCSMGTLFGLWLIAQQLGLRWLGLAAVTLLGVAPLDLEYSTLVRSDVNQVLALVFCLFFAIRIGRAGRTADFAFAGLWLGAATAAKWPSVRRMPDNHSCNAAALQ